MWCQAVRDSNWLEPMIVTFSQIHFPMAEDSRRQPIGKGGARRPQEQDQGQGYQRRSMWVTRSTRYWVPGVKNHVLFEGKGGQYFRALQCQQGGSDWWLQYNIYSQLCQLILSTCKENIGFLIFNLNMSQWLWLLECQRRRISRLGGQLSHCCGINGGCSSLFLAQDAGDLQVN